MMDDVFCGAGPGVQTPDGCSVEFYRALPYLGELDDIEPALQRGSAALELGCGTGRLCKRLAALGLQVTGVDESAQMLAHLPAGVEAVLSSIESLQLDRRWPVVLLASHLINHPDELVRSAFIAAARRHTAPGGAFFVKRHDPAWLATVESGLIGANAAVTYHADKVLRDGPRVSMTLRYEAFGAQWLQSFTTVALSEAEIESALLQHGYDQVEWLGGKRLWAVATVRRS